MMTSEEIKAWLSYCIINYFCQGCPIEKKCKADILSEARALIEQLEEQISLMKIQMHGDCGVCKHRSDCQINGRDIAMSKTCYDCMMKEIRPNWEYEGLPELPKKGATT